MDVLSVFLVTNSLVLSSVIGFLENAPGRQIDFVFLPYGNVGVIFSMVKEKQFSFMTPR